MIRKVTELKKGEILYLIIAEDGTVTPTNRVTPSDYQAMEDGVVDIIEIDLDGEKVVYYVADTEQQYIPPDRNPLTK